jgi:hypothetical protein
MYARDGVHIDRSTMAGWVDQGDELLDPLVAALGDVPRSVERMS